MNEEWVLVTQSCLTLCGHSLLQGIFPEPGIEPRSPALQLDSLLPQSPGKPLHIHISTLFKVLFPYSMGIQSIPNTECWVEFPMLYSRSLTAICFVNSSVYMSTSTSQFILIPPFCLGSHKFVFTTVTISILYISSFVWFF